LFVYTIGNPAAEFVVDFFQGGLAARASIDEPIGRLITTELPLAAVANLP
jgi:hypothetical protein